MADGPDTREAVCGGEQQCLEMRLCVLELLRQCCQPRRTGEAQGNEKGVGLLVIKTGFNGDHT